MKYNFVNKTGETLAGRLELPAGKARALALFAHCFTCSKDSVAAHSIALTLKKNGIGVLRFDFTGLGDSQGDFSVTGFSANVADLLSACAALAESHGSPAILIGHSLGGLAVLKAATGLDEVKAVVTLNAPSSLSHLHNVVGDNVVVTRQNGEKEVRLGGKTFLLKSSFFNELDNEFISDIRSFRKALLVMHGPHDEIVPIDHASAIFQAAKHPKSFITLDNADHLLSRRSDGEYVANVIAAWVERYLPSSDTARQGSGVSGTVRVISRKNQKYTQDIYSSEHHIIADEPADVGGANLGLNPYELLMGSLGACTAMTMKMYAERKNIPLKQAEVQLRHSKIHAKDCQNCETARGKVDKIEKQIKLIGDLSKEQKERLLEIAEKCPVNRTLLSEVLIEDVTQL